MQLSPDLAWMGTWPAAVAFGSAALLEVAAYYIPALDNLLDTLAVPAATIAGTLLTAAMFGNDMSPGLRWMLAIIAGGGTALTVSTSTAAARGASTVTTAGMANPVLSTVELITSTVLSILTLLLPIFGLVVAIVLVVALLRWRKRRAAKATANAGASPLQN